MGDGHSIRHTSVASRWIIEGSSVRIAGSRCWYRTEVLGWISVSLSGRLGAGGFGSTRGTALRSQPRVRSRKTNSEGVTEQAMYKRSNKDDGCREEEGKWIVVEV
jgi:hypothetical protein